MTQLVGFVLGKLLAIFPSMVLGWLHIGMAWLLAWVCAFSVIAVALAPKHPNADLPGAPKFVRTKAFIFVAAFYGVLNLAFYSLAFWLSPR